MPHLFENTYRNRFIPSSSANLRGSITARPIPRPMSPLPTAFDATAGDLPIGVAADWEGVRGVAFTNNGVCESAALKLPCATGV